jgi:hypothetical protein
MEVLRDYQTALGQLVHKLRGSPKSSPSGIVTQVHSRHSRLDQAGLRVVYKAAERQRVARFFIVYAGTA